MYVIWETNLILIQTVHRSFELSHQNVLVVKVIRQFHKTLVLYPPLNRVTLGLHLSDSINQMIQLIDVCV